MFKNQPWWQYLNSTQQSLIKQSFYLLNWTQKLDKKLFDYSFIVMPSAKAYEGFLKKFFFDLKLISKHDFEEEYFRVGKALNPELENIKHLQKECLYNEISAKCGEDTAKMLWLTWKKSRNRLFHYFHQEKQSFTLTEASNRLDLIIKSIKHAFSSCEFK